MTMGSNRPTHACLVDSVLTTNRVSRLASPCFLLRFSPDVRLAAHCDGCSTLSCYGFIKSVLSAGSFWDCDAVNGQIDRSRPFFTHELHTYQESFVTCAAMNHNCRADGARDLERDFDTEVQWKTNVHACAGRRKIF